eukprot:gene25849-11521_t
MKPTDDDECYDNDATSAEKSDDGRRSQLSVGRIRPAYASDAYCQRPRVLSTAMRLPSNAPVKDSMFVKKLSAVDAFTTKAIKLPRSQVQRIMGRLNQKQSAVITVTDERDRTWELLCTCHSTVYILSRIGNFCQAHDLHPGNYVMFYRDCSGRLRVHTSESYPESLISAAVPADQVSPSLFLSDCEPQLVQPPCPSPKEAPSGGSNVFQEPVRSAPPSRVSMESKHTVVSYLPGQKRRRSSCTRDGLHHLSKCSSSQNSFHASDSLTSTPACSQESSREIASPEASSSCAESSQAKTRPATCSLDRAAVFKDLIASGCSTLRANSLVRLHMASGSCPEVLKILKQKQNQQHSAVKRRRSLLG